MLTDQTALAAVAAVGDANFGIAAAMCVTFFMGVAAGVQVKLPVSLEVDVATSSDLAAANKQIAAGGGQGGDPHSTTAENDRDQSSGSSIKGKNFLNRL